VTATVERTTSSSAGVAGAAEPAGPLDGLLHWGRSPAMGGLRAVDALWGGFVVLMLATMLLIPDQETIPYHLIFVSFTLLYGYRMWQPRTTVAVLGAITVVTGVMFVRVYLKHDITWDELAEIPLMTLIVGGGAWHAYRSARHPYAGHDRTRQYRADPARLHRSSAPTGQR
jgi:two-component system OmpR family sensor kinase